MDLASHAPAAVERITGLPKRPQHLLPQQNESTFLSSTLPQGAGNIWMRPLRVVSTPAGVHRATGFLDFTGQKVEQDLGGQPRRD